MRMTLRATHAAVAILTVLGAASEARASSGLDSPDNGVVQVGRGSAWLARADDPLAAYFNPAAMSFQASGVHLGAHLMFQKQCYERKGPGGTLVSPGGGVPAPGTAGIAAEVCTEMHPFPNPQLAGVWRVTNKLALGLAALGPHAAGKKVWPDSTGSYTNSIGSTVSGSPAPNRYILTSADSLLMSPTISASYAITDNLSIGAGFIWGIATVEFQNFAEVLSSTPLPKTQAGTVSDDFAGHFDAKARLRTKDLFVPGFVASAMWSPHERIDIAGWFRWQDAIRAKTDLYVESHYWKANGAEDTSDKGHTNAANQTDVKEAGTIKFNIPMEARLGFRYHHPRASAANVAQDAAAAPGGTDAVAAPKPANAPPPPQARKVRDPLSQDVFDIELDFTWANNSAVQDIELRFRGPEASGGIGGAQIPINGVCSTCFVPPNGDIPHKWKDVFGARLGGDVVILPSRLALRAGGWIESRLQDDAYLNLDFPGGMKGGVSGGATLRLGPVDISAAYQHTFYANMDNGGNGEVRALSGDSSTTLNPPFRSQQIVNGGKLTTTLNEVALGGTLRF